MVLPAMMAAFAVFQSEASTERSELERTALALAESGKPGDIATLGRMLRDQTFLARVDDPAGLRTQQVGRIITALGQHPTVQAIELCRTLAEDPVFIAVSDRKGLVLEVLAREKPMSDATAGVFQRSNAEGYFAFNARLLAENGSPRAIALFGSMMLDKSVEAESRVQTTHVGIVPRRMNPAILGAALRILTATTEPAIANAVAESVFDYRQEWFGLESGVSEPPPWDKAPLEARRAASAVATKALARRDLDARLRRKIQRVQTVIQREAGG